MIDDYLLKLCLTDEALSAFCRGVSQVAYRPQKASELESIIGRLAVELGKAGISVDSSKRYLDLIRATIGFAASRARFAELLISRSPQHLLRKCSEPYVMTLLQILQLIPESIRENCCEADTE